MGGDNPAPYNDAVGFIHNDTDVFVTTLLQRAGKTKGKTVNWPLTRTGEL